ncbi:MAG: hypothetical protein QM715_03865 [Nibricoccus sp.]
MSVTSAAGQLSRRPQARHTYNVRETMRYLLIFIGSICGLYAANTTCSELATNLEHGVQTIASGRIDDGLTEISAQGVPSRSPKERAENNQKFRDALKQMSGFGAARRVVRFSTLYIGEGYCRIRVLDRRNAGAILWTFFCERDGDSWFMCSVTMTANSEFGNLMKELDAADYAKEEQKTP